LRSTVLFVDGEDVRGLPLKERKALLEKIVRRHRMQRSEPVLGDGKAAFQAVCELDLEGIVAKRLADAYGPGRTRWWKVLNRGYSQKAGRAELFERRYG
jgi:bifunctional non-homologous end joining protein LigD